MIYLYTYLADIFIQIDLQMKTIEAFKTNKIWIFFILFLLTAMLMIICVEKFIILYALQAFFFFLFV